MSWEADLVGISGGVVRELDKIFRQEADMVGLRARIDANRIAAATRSGRVNRKAVDGLGALRMQVPSDSYHYWGQRLGYECWKDKQFLREYERDNPEVRVKCGGTRVQSGWNGIIHRTSVRVNDEPLRGTGAENAETEGKRRFRKVYN